MNNLNLCLLPSFRPISQTTLNMGKFVGTKLRVRVKQRTYFPLVAAMEMAIWQAILT
jgi:hypothetical protein